MIPLIVLLSWLALPGRAESPPAPSKLPEFIEVARRRNPEIIAARKSWEMAKARILPAKTWPAPEVGVEYWGFPRQSANVGSASETWYDVAQTIPFPGKLSLRGKSAVHQARREEAVYRATERDITAKIKEAYYGLLLAQRSIKLYDDTVEILRRFANIAGSKYAVGKTSQPNVLKAQVELSKMQNRAITARQEIETSRAKLNALLDRRPEEPVSADDEPVITGTEPPIEELEKTALAHSPEVNAANHHVNHMQAELAAKRADYLPDFMVQYTLRTRDGLRPDSVAVLKMTLPFVWFWRQGSIVKSTRFETEHADAMFEAEKVKTAYEIKDSLTQVQTARRLVELYKTTILPQTEQSLKVSESGYRSDVVTFLDLLDSERVYVDSALEYYKAVSDYGVMLARLERVLGTELSAAAGGGNDEHDHEYK